MRSINEISPEKQSRPWERGICSLVSPMGSGFGFDPQPGSLLDPGVYLRIPGIQNYRGTVETRAGQALLAIANAQKTGSNGMTPAAATAAPSNIYIVIAILFFAWVLK